MQNQDDVRPRLLIVDDNIAIHDDFRKILLRPDERAAEVMNALEDDLFGEEIPVRSPVREATDFELVCAEQGQQALQAAIEANAINRPFSVAFMDVRMPPGLDGVETSVRLLEADPFIQIVICTAYSDYDWNEIIAKVGSTDRVLILKKPFDAVEVRQLAHALHRKWCLTRDASSRLDELERRVAERTRDLSSANTALRHEMERRQQIEAELRLSQRLQALGQLAAGIAHEINTPLQFIGDNLHFLKEAHARLQAVIQTHAEWAPIVALEVPAAAAAISRAEEHAELPFLEQHIPLAFEQSESGVKRVTSIVQSLRAFGRNEPVHKTPTSLNEVITSTLAMSRGAYKNVADVELELGDLPMVECHAGDISQVLVNLIVNAAHAIEDSGQPPGGRGRIAVASRHDGAEVEISVTDTGCGIPNDVRERVFDPFFTTKDVGKGTGQGLAIARTSVVDRHGGTLTFESEPGRGTCFRLRIPVVAPRSSHEVGA